MRHLVAILFTLTAACATDDTQGPITRNERDPSQYDPAACHAACRVALGLCDITTTEDRRLLESCTQQCPFDLIELRCLAATSCGSDPTCY